MRRSFRRTFVAGLFIALPLFVTVGVIQFMLAQVERISPVVIEMIGLLGLGHWLRDAWVDVMAPLLSVALGVLTIWLVGLVGGNVLGRQLFKGLERLVLHLPVAGTIYSAARQFVQTFSQSNGRAFSRVVLLEFPRPNVWAVGLVTGKAPFDVLTQVPAVVSVFVPTSPNPTSGYLVYATEDQLKPVNMTVDDAFKLIISGGVLVPPPSTRPAR